jgi:hypothetical protein
VNNHWKLFKRIIRYFAGLNLFRFLPDRAYLKLLYFVCLGKKLNLEAPKSFTEKIQWLKLFDRRPQYTLLVDKFTVRQYITKTIGEEYLIPIVGGPWKKFDEINIENLPNRFVLKCTHDSGGVVICDDKSTIDWNFTKKKISKNLRRNYYWYGREWPYKNVKPLIIAEKYMVDESGYELKDYKFFCFNGKPRIMFIATDRGSKTEQTKFDFFDMNFNHLPIKNGHENSTKKITKPNNFDEMKEIAEKLSNGFTHLRVDLYEINGKIYFGELTFYHWSGLVSFEPAEWDYFIGNLLELPERHFKNPCTSN